MKLESDNGPAIHHITYEFSPLGLSEAIVAYHIEDVKDALSEEFGIARDAVLIMQNKKAETIDVRVMVGGSQDEIRKIAATRVVQPLFSYLFSQPAVTAARESGFTQVVLTVVKPRQVAGVANG